MDESLKLTMIFQPLSCPLIFKDMVKKSRKDIEAGKILITTDGKQIICEVFDKDLAEENRKMYEKWESKNKIKKMIGYRALKLLGIRKVIDHERNKTISL